MSQPPRHQGSSRLLKLPSFAVDFQTKIIKFTNQYNQNNCFLNVVVQNIWHLPAFKPVILQVIKNWQAAQIKKELNFVEKALSPMKSKLFLALGQFLNELYECEEDSTLNVYPLKVELFR